MKQGGPGCLNPPDGCIPFEHTAQLQTTAASDNVPRRDAKVIAFNGE